MQDKRALQAGTSHFLGQNFAKAFNVVFQNQHGEEELVWATSWGVSTRLIGALIMTHSDDRGLVIPPRCAPTEIVIVPIYKENTRAEVLSHCQTLHTRLARRFRVVADVDAHNSPGWKFAEWELRGVPLRIECGPRDIAANSVTVVRRDSGAKARTPLSALEAHCADTLENIQQTLYQNALRFQHHHTHHHTDYREFIRYLSEGTGLAYAAWDGAIDTERRVKEESGATIRIINEPPSNPTCIISGRPARYTAVFAKNY